MPPSSLGRTKALLQGDTLKAKALRATLWSLVGVFGQNGMRLLSNIVLTRLLFPEAFGLMALVQVFIVGLQTFSDIGIQTSIVQSKRGNDPVFLNTAWTLQILRGFGLWLMACVIAWPAAQIYDQPELLLLLPATALSLIGQGFRPTRAAQAERSLMLGRLTTIQLFVQAVTLILTGLLAWWWQSVWALAISQVISTSIANVLTRIYLPGHPNRLCWDRESLHEIVGFGRFILLSTAATFLILMSDRAILGAYVDVTLFGIYNIALTFGSLPNMIVQTIGSKVLFPLYRLKSPTESAESRRQIFKAGRAVAAFGILVAVAFAGAGLWLIDLLYDDRYRQAGPMLVLFALGSVPGAVLIGSQSVLLSHGDSRRHFYLTATSAAVQVSLLFLSIHLLGVAGAILAPGLTLLVTYPLRAAFMRRYRAWDPLNDLLGLSLGLAVTGLACAWHWEQIRTLFP